MSQEKVVLITGASTGFGNAAARKLADQGHRVFASMRNVAGKNAENAKALRAYSTQISVVELDVTQDPSVKAAVEEVVQGAGRIEVLVNNAGVLHMGITEAFSIDQLRQQMEVNYFGVARMFAAVLPHMRAKREGLIITVTSIAGRVAFPFMTTYNSTKFAAEALSEGFRYDLSPLGIDSVLLEPGPFKTDLPGHAVFPAKQEVLKGYGAFADKPKEILEGFLSFMDENEQGDANPQVVADDIARIIAMPFGTRPLRTVSGLDYGVRDLNKVTAEYQTQILKGMDLEFLDPNHTPAKSGA